MTQALASHLPSWPGQGKSGQDGSRGGAQAPPSLCGDHRWHPAERGHILKESAHNQPQEIPIRSPVLPQTPANNMILRPHWQRGSKSVKQFAVIPRCSTGGADVNKIKFCNAQPGLLQETNGPKSEGRDSQAPCTQAPGAELGSRKGAGCAAPAPTQADAHGEPRSPCTPRGSLPGVSLSGPQCLSL